jgi:REP element-mobilizing transposase RayT
VAQWRPYLQGEAVYALYREWEQSRAALDVKVLAYVVMPEHFHALLWGEPASQVRVFLQKTLAYSSRAIRPGGGFWKERARVIAVYSSRSLETKLNYLHANPIRRQLVGSPGDWVHSSFRQIEMGETDVPFICDPWAGVVV